MKVLILKDDKPGHFNQSYGIIKALELLCPLEVERVDVKMRFGFCRQIMKMLLNFSSFQIPHWVLRSCYEFDLFPNKPDMIISAGGKTSFLNAALAREYSCMNIFAGSLRGLSDRLFSAVLTLEPIPGAQNNLVVDISPTIIDPEEVRKAGERYRDENGLGKTRLWAMIIGGDGAGYTYTENDWKQLANAMQVLADTHNVRWLLTTSRRTGPKAEEVLKRALPEVILADSVWYHSKPRKIMQSFLGASEVVFCSEDSMSMITEAIASGRPVFSLRPFRTAPDKKYREALERFECRCWLSRVSLSEAPYKIDSDVMNPIIDHPAKTLAQQLRYFCNIP